MFWFAYFKCMCTDTSHERQTREILLNWRNCGDCRNRSSTFWLIDLITVLHAFSKVSLICTIHDYWLIWTLYTMVAESSTRCNFRKHMQIETAPANQENVFIILTADGENAHDTNK